MSLLGTNKRWWCSANTDKALLAVGLAIALMWQPGEAATFSVKEFSINGENPIGDKQSQALLAPYLNRALDIEELRAGAKVLEEAMAIRGYNFYRVVLPPQQLVNEGRVKLNIEKITLGRVSVTGNKYHSDKNIIDSMPILAPGESPNTARVATQLILAQENPTKDVRVVFTKGSQPQTIDAIITANDTPPHDLQIWANNSGSDLSSRSRMGVQYSHRNLWDKDHELSLSYGFSPEDLDELNQYGISYTVPIYRFGGKLSSFYSRSDVDTGRVADVFDVSGSGDTFGFSYTQFLPKRGQYEHRLGFGITDKLFDSEVLFNDADIAADIRSRPISVFYTGRWIRKQLRINGNAAFYRNLSGGSRNNAQAYQEARAGADNDWTRTNLSLNATYRHSQLWTSSLAFDAQLTSDALVSGEKYGFGGVVSSPRPRGFLEREVSVDEGFKFTAEVWRSFPTRDVDVGFFYDYADGDNNVVQAGEFASQTLQSTGVAMRWRPRKNIYVEADAGYVIDGIDSVDGGPTDDGDSRLHFSIRYFPVIGGKPNE